MTRVLFVDDQPQVLEGIRDMMRGRRREWEMSFVTSGAAALEELAQHPFDVVVTDMRMPGMDGAELLRQVRDAHPGCARIVLSGQTELGAAVRAVSAAHGFLAKPCEAERLQNTIERAAATLALLDDDALRARIGGAARLPSLPRVYRLLTEALESPDASAADIAVIVEQDMVISLRLLQLVNSSFFGLGRPVSSVKAAIAYLGFSLIKEIVLFAAVFGELAPDETAGEFSLEALQDHSLLVGRIASDLLTDPIEREAAYTAGVFHDIGKLVLALQQGPDDGAPAADPAAPEDHALAGAFLLGLWGLPLSVVEAVACHHAPGTVESTHLDPLGAVHIADALAHEIEDGARNDLLDLDWLERNGLADRPPEWRDQALAVSLKATA